MTPRKSLWLSLVVLFGAAGDVMLSRGMKDLGEISLQNLHHAVLALANPWVAGGTLLLIVFLAGYLAALSWADLTYVLPATSMGYVVVALLSVFLLGERVTLARWAGIALITCGVGFVAGGPIHTSKERRAELEAARQRTADQVAPAQKESRG